MNGVLTIVPFRKPAVKFDPNFNPVPAAGPPSTGFVIEASVRSDELGRPLDEEKARALIGDRTAVTPGHQSDFQLSASGDHLSARFVDVKFGAA